MPICKECLNKEICNIKLPPNECLTFKCSYFKDRSKLYIELPCKVGTKIYYHLLGVIQCDKIAGFMIGKNGVDFMTNFGLQYETSMIGKHFFFTREEAEQALKECEEE